MKFNRQHLEELTLQKIKKFNDEAGSTINSCMTFDSLVKRLLTENLQKLKKYSVVVPPTSKEECINILLNNDATSKGTCAINVNGKDVEVDCVAAIKKMSINTLRHEALHVLQMEKIPDIFKNLPKLSHKFNTSEDYKKKHYYNRPPEIMAYAYDACMGVNTKLNDKVYKEIGGDVYDLYLHYKEEYSKKIKTTDNTLKN